MKGKGERRSLLAYLREVPDPRGRQGRRYRLECLLAILILAALNGEQSLRGMWVWAQHHAEMLIEELQMWEVGRIPALDTFWNLMRRLDVEAFLRAVNRWLAAWEGVESLSLDEKVLRGSKREGEQALQVITAFAQRLGRVLEQVEVPEGDQTKAALALLEGVPLEGKVVTMDAGLLERPVVKTIVEKGGPIWGQ